MRIISGKWRSRRISVPPSDRTRPMPDRVKEAIFSILGSSAGTPGRLPAVRVADFFAGSGSLGLEAVSRGAAECVFVERGRGALRVLNRNVNELEQDEPLRVVAADAWTCKLDELAGDGPGFGVVFLDPPYRDARQTGPTGKVPRLLKRILAGDFLAADGVVVLHHERRVSFQPAATDSWALTDRREYGSTAISFLGPAELAPADPPANNDVALDG